MPGLLEEGIRAAILTETADWWASCPAKVLSVSQDGSTVDAQPLVRRVYTADQTSTSRPVVAAVPFLLPAAGDGQLILKPAVGDTVILVFASRSLDEVRANGWTEGTPRDSRRFSMSDAFALPFRTASTPSVHLRMVDGKVALGTDAVEVVDILYQLLDALRTATAGGNPLSIQLLAGSLADDLATILEP